MFLKRVFVFVFFRNKILKHVDSKQMEEEEEALRLGHQRDILQGYFRPKAINLCKAFDILSNTKILALAEEYLKYRQWMFAPYEVERFRLLEYAVAELRRKMRRDIAEDDATDAEIRAAREHVCEVLSDYIDKDIHHVSQKMQKGEKQPQQIIRFDALGEMEMIHIVESMIFDGGLRPQVLLGLGNQKIVAAVYALKKSRRYKKAALRVVRYMVSCAWHHAFVEAFTLDMPQIDNFSMNTFVARTLMIFSANPMVKKDSSIRLDDTWDERRLQEISQKMQAKINTLYNLVLNNPHEIVRLKFGYAQTFFLDRSVPHDVYDDYTNYTKEIPLVCSQPFADGSYVTDFDEFGNLVQNTSVLPNQLFNLYSEIHFDPKTQELREGLRDMICGANLCYMYLNEEVLDLQKHSFLELSPLRFSFAWVFENAGWSASKLFEVNQRWKLVLNRDENVFFEQWPSLREWKAVPRVLAERILKRIRTDETRGSEDHLALVQWLMQKSGMDCLIHNARRMQRMLLSIQNLKQADINVLYGPMNPDIGQVVLKQEFGDYLRQTVYAE